MNTGDKAYANTPSGGSPLGFNSLFVRLNNIRANHLNKDGQNATANATFATAFPTNVSVRDSAIPRSDPQKLKDELTTLAQSEWINNTYASRITVPAVGSLITAADFNSWSNTIGEVEAICPNYSHYGTRYGTRYGSQYSGDYSAFYGAFYGNFYGNFYGSRYNTNYSAFYGTRYGSLYTNQYGAFYSSFYGSRYGSNYRAFYGLRYRTRYKCSRGEYDIA